jgi:hypothetical protein
MRSPAPHSVGHTLRGPGKHLPFVRRAIHGRRRPVPRWAGASDHSTGELKSFSRSRCFYSYERLNYTFPAEQCARRLRPASRRALSQPGKSMMSTERAAGVRAEASRRRRGRSHSSWRRRCGPTRRSQRSRCRTNPSLVERRTEPRCLGERTNPPRLRIRTNPNPRNPLRLIGPRAQTNPSSRGRPQSPPQLRARRRPQASSRQHTNRSGAGSWQLIAA